MAQMFLYPFFQIVQQQQGHQQQQEQQQLQQQELQQEQLQHQQQQQQERTLVQAVMSFPLARFGYFSYN